MANWRQDPLEGIEVDRSSTSSYNESGQRQTVPTPMLDVVCPNALVYSFINTKDDNFQRLPPPLLLRSMYESNSLVRDHTGLRCEDHENFNVGSFLGKFTAKASSICVVPLLRPGARELLSQIIPATMTEVHLLFSDQKYTQFGLEAKPCQMSTTIPSLVIILYLIDYHFRVRPTGRLAIAKSNMMRETGQTDPSLEDYILHRILNNHVFLRFRRELDRLDGELLRSAMMAKLGGTPMDVRFFSSWEVAKKHKYEFIDLDFEVEMTQTGVQDLRFRTLLTKKSEGSYLELKKLVDTQIEKPLKVGVEGADLVQENVKVRFTLNKMIQMLLFEVKKCSNMEKGRKDQLNLLVGLISDKMVHEHTDFDTPTSIRAFVTQAFLSMPLPRNSMAELYFYMVTNSNDAKTMQNALNRFRGVIGEMVVCQNKNLVYREEDEKLSVDQILDEIGMSEIKELIPTLRWPTPDAWQYDSQNKILNLVEMGWVRNKTSKQDVDSRKWGIFRGIWGGKLTIVTDCIIITNEDGIWVTAPDWLKTCKEALRSASVHLDKWQPSNKMTDLVQLKGTIDARMTTKIKHVKMMIPTKVVDELDEKCEEAVGGGFLDSVYVKPHIVERGDKIFNMMKEFLNRPTETKKVSWVKTTDDSLSKALKQMKEETLEVLVPQLNSSKKKTVLNLPMIKPNPHRAKLMIDRRKKYFRTTKPDFSKKAEWLKYKTFKDYLEIAYQMVDGKKYWVTRSGDVGIIDDKMFGTLRGFSKQLKILDPDFKFPDERPFQEDDELDENIRMMFSKLNPFATLSEEQKLEMDSFKHHPVEERVAEGGMSKLDVEGFLDDLPSSDKDLNRLDEFEKFCSTPFYGCQEESIRAIGQHLNYVVEGEKQSGSIGDSCEETKMIYDHLIKSNDFTTQMCCFAVELSRSIGDLKNTNRRRPQSLGKLTNVGNYGLVLISSGKVSRSYTCVLSEPCVYDRSLSGNEMPFFYCNSRLIRAWSSSVDMLASYIGCLAFSTGSNITEEFIKSVDLTGFNLLQLHNNRQVNVLMQSLRYFVMGVVSSHHVDNLGKKLSAKLKSGADLLILRFYYRHAKFLLGARSKILSDMSALVPKFDYMPIFQKTLLRGTSQSLISDFYWHHAFDKEFIDDDAEIVKVMKKFTEPKMVLQKEKDIDSLAWRLSNGSVREPLELRVDHIMCSTKKNPAFISELVAGCHKVQSQIPSIQKWRDTALAETPLSDLVKNTSTIDTFEEKFDYEGMKKKVETIDERNKLLRCLDVKDKVIAEALANQINSQLRPSPAMKSLETAKKRPINELASIDLTVFIRWMDKEHVSPSELETEFNKMVNQDFKVSVNKLLRAYDQKLNFDDGRTYYNMALEINDDYISQLFHLNEEYPEILAIFMADLMNYDNTLPLNENSATDVLAWKILVDLNPQRSFNNLMYAAVNFFKHTSKRVLQEDPMQSIRNRRIVTTDMVLNMLTDSAWVENADVYSAMMHKGFNSEGIKFGIAKKQQYGAERELTLSDGEGKTILKCAELPLESLTGLCPNSCLNSENAEESFKKRILSMQLENKPANTRIYYESSDHSKWAPYLNSIMFLIANAQYKLDGYEDIVSYVMKKHALKKFEIPPLVILRIMRKIVHKVQLEDWEEFLHEILKTGKKVVYSVSDMGQGMVQNGSDILGSAVSAESCRLAVLLAKDKFPELQDIFFDDMNTSDDHSCSWKIICRLGSPDGTHEAVMAYVLDAKWLFQKLCGLHLSEKSIVSEKLCEFKSSFMTDGIEARIVFKFVSSQLMIGKDVKPEDYYMSACSASQQLLSQTGCMALANIIMNSFCWRMSQQFDVLTDGPNRIFKDDTKQLLLPPECGGFPFVGPATLTLGLMDVNILSRLIELSGVSGDVDVFAGCCGKASLSRSVETSRTMGSLFDMGCYRPRNRKEREKISEMVNMLDKSLQDDALRTMVFQQKLPHTWEGGKYRTQTAYVAYKMKSNTSDTDRLRLMNSTKNIAKGVFFKTSDNRRVSFKEQFSIKTGITKQELIDKADKIYSGQLQQAFNLTMADRTPLTGTSMIHSLYSSSFKRMEIFLKDTPTDNDLLTVYVYYKGRHDLLSVLDASKVTFESLPIDVKIAEKDLSDIGDDVSVLKAKLNFKDLRTCPGAYLMAPCSSATEMAKSSVGRLTCINKHSETNLFSRFDYNKGKKEEKRMELKLCGLYLSLLSLTSLSEDNKRNSMAKFLTLEIDGTSLATHCTIARDPNERSGRVALAISAYTGDVAAKELIKKLGTETRGARISVIADIMRAECVYLNDQFIFEINRGTGEGRCETTSSNMSKMGKAWTYMVQPKAFPEDKTFNVKNFEMITIGTRYVKQEELGDPIETLNHGSISWLFPIKSNPVTLDEIWNHRMRSENLAKLMNHEISAQEYRKVTQETIFDISLEYHLTDNQILKIIQCKEIMHELFRFSWGENGALMLRMDSVTDRVTELIEMKSNRLNECLASYTHCSSVLQDWSEKTNNDLSLLVRIRSMFSTPNANTMESFQGLTIENIKDLTGENPRPYIFNNKAFMVGLGSSIYNSAELFEVDLTLPKALDFDTPYAIFKRSDINLSSLMKSLDLADMRANINKDFLVVEMTEAQYDRLPFFAPLLMTTFLETEIWGQPDEEEQN